MVVPYSVIVTRPAQSAVDLLAPMQAQCVFVALRALAANPRPSGCIKLTNSDEWRIRVGDYRVIYEINDTELLVTVIAVGHRCDVYR